MSMSHDARTAATGPSRAWGVPGTRFQLQSLTHQQQGTSKQLNHAKSQLHASHGSKALDTLFLFTHFIEEKTEIHSGLTYNSYT